MNKQQLALHKALLFSFPPDQPTLQTYAIVDSVRDVSSKKNILFSGLHYQDLWHPNLSDNEQQVPLYLVALDRQNDLLDYLLVQHQTGSTVYFISPYPLATLQAYYSRLTYPYIETQPKHFEKGIFGFYDPNIISNFVQTIYTNKQADQFFAGTSIWLYPGLQSPDELHLVYRDSQGKACQAVIDLDSILDKPSPILDFSSINLPDPALINQPYEHILDNRQVQHLAHIEKVTFCRKLLAQTDQQDSDENLKKALGGLEQAIALDLRSEAVQARFIYWHLNDDQPEHHPAFFQQLGQLDNEHAKAQRLDQQISALGNRLSDTLGKQINPTTGDLG